MRKTLKALAEGVALAAAVVLAAAGCVALVLAPIAWFAVLPSIGLLYTIGWLHG